jgi:hypothetical protein
MERAEHGAALAIDHKPAESQFGLADAGYLEHLAIIAAMQQVAYFVRALSRYPCLSRHPRGLARR